MGYVLSTDDTKVFDLLCGNLEFKNINTVFFSYLPPKILEIIISHNTLSSEQKMMEYTSPIDIDMYKLTLRTPEQIIMVSEMVNRIIKYKPCVNFISICTRYNFTECLYIRMYWDYLTLMTNDLENITVILASILGFSDNKNLSNFQLDVLILKTVIDNYIETVWEVTNSGVDARDNQESELFLTLLDSFDRIVNIIKNNVTISIKGPDYIEIMDELKMYGVYNLNFLSEMCEFAEKYDDRYNEHTDDDEKKNNNNDDDDDDDGEKKNNDDNGDDDDDNGDDNGDDDDDDNGDDNGDDDIWII